MSQCAFIELVNGYQYYCQHEAGHKDKHLTEPHVARQQLIQDLIKVYNKHLANGHRQWCRKYGHPGVECSCGSSPLVALLTKLEVEEQQG